MRAEMMSRVSFFGRKMPKKCVGAVVVWGGIAINSG